MRTPPSQPGADFRALGAQIVAVTCGATGVQIVADDAEAWIAAVPAPIVVDQTGAGDAYVGTLTARLVLGDDLIWAARQAAAASSWSWAAAAARASYPRSTRPDATSPSAGKRSHEFASA